ncbi:MAG TPA: class I SAM-dependent methyltransferase [Gemmatimonadaceae bacterium]|nr:class I SAM-dependent methyltransferase [Gemmatimonadaceae bacterium]
MTGPAYGEDRYRGDAGEEYFAWQAGIGRLGGTLDRWKFEAFVRPTDAVLDFGCGGGFLLDTLACARKVGVELNAAPRRHAASLGIEVHESLASVPDASVDVVISNHALEHVRAPHDVLAECLRVLRPGGRAVVVVPYEGWLMPEPFQPGDVNQHLYAWAPMPFGNLFQSAGFAVDVSEVLWSAWTPGAWKRWGWNATLYRWACFVLALRYRAPQLRVVARRPAP